MTDRPSRSATFGAQTAGRAMQLLQLIVASSRPPSLAELAATLGVNKSAVYRLARELEEQQLVVTTDDHRYVAGPALVALSARVLSRLDLRSLAHKYLLEASDRTRETIGLHIRSGSQRVCIDVVEAIHPVRRYLNLGETYPLYAGPSGKVILAYLPEPEIDSILARAAEHGEDVAAIRKRLAEIRQKGYMAAIGDQHPGVGGLSVPIFNFKGVVASMTISGPSERWTLEAMEAAAPDVVAIGAELSRALGATEPDELSRNGDKRR
ncbi:MAG: IclR family transcriptional regulator [Dehalococcoidia bacterium]|nr:MAG: IclR family transcriptional regulator [Dehalococcoidia bacterium]